MKNEVQLKTVNRYVIDSGGIYCILLLSDVKLSALYIDVFKF